MKPISLKQAWDLALQAGHNRWGNQVVMAELSSIDAPGDTTQAGANGQRRAWMARLVVAGHHDISFVETISDGLVVRQVKVPAPTRAPAMRREPKIDSPTAIQTARATRPDLAPGTEREHGFGFVTHIDVHGRPVIAVMGSYRTYPMQVDVDARSGKVVGTLIYTWTTRLPCSTDAGKTWRWSNLTGGLIPAVSVIPGTSNAAYALVATVRAIQLWKSTNGGCVWSRVSTLPGQAGGIAHALAVLRLPHLGMLIAAGTSSGLWLSRNSGRSWTHNATLDTSGSDGAQWVAPGWLDRTRAVLVTVGSGLYASSDLHSWHKIADQSYRLSLTDDGKVAVALPDDGSGAGDINRQGHTMEALHFPAKAWRAAGQFQPGGVALAESVGAIVQSTDGGNHWSRALNVGSAGQTLTGITVGPGFPTNGVALASGIDGSIWRSTDGGRTWHQLYGVKVPMGGEGGDIMFLRAADAVIADSGPAIWKSF